jgi:hypothetical protein
MAYIEKTANTGELDIWLNCADGRNKTCTSQWAAESLNDALVWAYRNTDDTEVERDRTCRATITIRDLKLSRGESQLQVYV